METKDIPRDDKEKFKRFQEFMIKGIDEHMEAYGLTWKKEEEEQLGRDYLEIRLEAKLEEFKLTKNNDKLISVANLAMLLFCKKELK